jgi:hypothetical protein
MTYVLQGVRVWHRVSAGCVQGQAGSGIVQHVRHAGVGDSLRMGRRQPHTERRIVVGVTGSGICGCKHLVRHATEPDSIQDTPQRQHAELKEAQPSSLALTRSPEGAHAEIDCLVADV